MLDVSVVIPNFNRASLLERALKSVSNQTHPPAAVVVADNGSTDGSVECANRFGARVVRFNENLGFSRAVNEAVKQCTTRYIMVLNNDAVLAPECLARLCDTAGDYAAGFAAPMVMSETAAGNLDGAWDLLAMSGCALRAGHGRKPNEPFLSTRPVTFAPFTAILIDRVLFQRLGGLNEQFGTYMEDVEFCLRCAMAGESGVYEPLAQATHLGSATDGPWSQRMVYQISRNQLLLVALHWPRPLSLRLAWTVFIGQSLWGLLALRRGCFSAWLRGKRKAYAQWDEFRKRPPCAGSREFFPILHESDLAIRRLSRGAYWRIYRMLTPFGGS
jgi:GT2 family glycosyltransferase